MVSCVNSFIPEVLSFLKKNKTSERREDSETVSHCLLLNKNVWNTRQFPTWEIVIRLNRVLGPSAVYV